MHISATLLCLLLTTAAFSTLVLSQPDALSATSTCCFKFNSRKIPLQILKSYQVTSSHCSRKAIIFTTKQNKEICADPKFTWVQDRMNNLQGKSHSLKTSNAPVTISPSPSTRNASFFSTSLPIHPQD